jgi:membrane protease YdiL (CAAX protease family)
VPFEQHPVPWLHAQFGLVMCLARWRSRSIIPGGVLHAIGNSLYHLA